MENYNGKEVNMTFTNNQNSIEGVGDCPNCANTLYYQKKSKVVECPCCGTYVNVADIIANNKMRRKESVSQSALQPVNASIIDSPESALVYLEKFFKDYDWEAYNLSSVISIIEIDPMVEKTKIKFGATSHAWVLDFESKIRPLTEKINSLEKQEHELVENYNGNDFVPIKSKYELYERTTHTLKNSCEKLFSVMESDIEYAERFGAGASVLESMRERLDAVRELYAHNVHDFESFDEVPALSEKKALYTEKIAEQLRLNGIDAEKIYEEAVDIYENYEDKNEALSLFSLIREYKDSADYISDINKFFDFDQKLIKLADKHFLLRSVKTPIFEIPKNSKKRKKKKNDDDIGTYQEQPQPRKRQGKSTFALFEVINGKAYEPAAVNGISQFLAFYSNKLFYVKRDRSLYSYDIVTHVETELDRGLVGGYPGPRVPENTEYPVYIKKNTFATSDVYESTDGTAFYIRKKLSPFYDEEPRGCIKSLFSIFKKRELPFTDDKNNYSVIKVDMAANIATVEIDRLVDITECYNDRMFYIAYHEIKEDKTSFLDSESAFMVCDLRTGEKKQVLGEDCQIYNVVDGKVIYSTWEPNTLNKNLYSYDLNTEEKVLIESNVFECVDIIDGRVYYTVGNYSKYAEKRTVLF